MPMFKVLKFVEKNGEIFSVTFEPIMQFAVLLDLYAKVSVSQEAKIA